MRRTAQDALRLDLELVAALAHLALAIRHGDAGWIRRAQVGVGALRLACHKREREDGAASPLTRIAAIFHLSPRERSILMCVVAPHFADDVAELFAELADDPVGWACTPTLLDHLLGGVATEE